MKLLTFLIVLVISIIVLDLVIDNVESRECVRWQSSSGEFADWQIKQCEYHNIELN